jgi:hypothetical protein
LIQKFPSIDVSSTPRRETYTVADSNVIQNCVNNKENQVARNFTAVLQETTSVTISPFLFNLKKREPFSPLTHAITQPGVSENAANISTDSLEVSPVKPHKLKFLENLNAEFLCSPLVTQKSIVATNKNYQIPDMSAVTEKIDAVGTTFFSETNFSDLSFATRRCSTASKGSDKRINTEISPRTKVSPRALHFSPLQERRLSSGTYVVSASNSLEAASGDSGILPPSSPLMQSPLQRLSRVPELPEHTEDSEWSVQLTGCNNMQKVQLTVLPAEDIDISLDISALAKGPIVQPCSSSTFEISHTQQYTEQPTTQATHPVAFDVSPPHTQVKAEPEITPSTCHHQRTEKEKSCPVTFTISPPALERESIITSSVSTGCATIKEQTACPVDFQMPPSTIEFELTVDPTSVQPENSTFIFISPPKPFTLPTVEWQSLNTDSSICKTDTGIHVILHDM